MNSRRGFFSQISELWKRRSRSPLGEEELKMMIGTICSSLILPLAGRLIDRLGVRVIVVIAATGLGLSLVALLEHASDRHS